MGTGPHLQGERHRRGLPVLLLLATAYSGVAAPALRWRSAPENPYRAWVECTRHDIQALPPDERGRADLLSVRVASAPRNPPLPPMAGILSIEENTLRFRPRFPLEPGLRYTATLRSGTTILTAEITAPPRAPQVPARVTMVTPTPDTLPLNLLKFYIHFSAPMSRGSVYEHIALRDVDGKRVADPFLELPQELWNPEMTRLTVLLDPGRIKRGLLPNKLVGAVLAEGKQYVFTIDRTLKDASGQLLERRFQKTFRAGPPDYTQPAPKRWRLDHPAKGTRDPLRVSFTKALDHALASRLLTVRRQSGHPVPGQVSLKRGDTVWEFRPDHLWVGEAHHLHVDHRLEDLAGNSIERPFEDALDPHPESAGAPPPHSRLPFTPE